MSVKLQEEVRHLGQERSDLQMELQKEKEERRDEKEREREERTVEVQKMREKYQTESKVMIFTWSSVQVSFFSLRGI